MTFTVPNLLSLLRMGLVPLFIIAVLGDRPKHALGIFVLAGITDLLDGLIARFWSQQSLLGTYLDPIADKLLLISAYAVLSVPSLGPGPVIPLWVSVLVIARDVVIVIVSLILNMVLKVERFPPAMIGKLTTAMQIVAVVAVLVARLVPGMEMVADIAVLLAVGLTIASGLNYVYRANRLAVDRAG